MSDLPFLPENWRKRAAGIAREVHNQPVLSDVPQALRARILDRVGEGMERDGVVPPAGWRETLARQCGWEPGGDA